VRHWLIMHLHMWLRRPGKKWDRRDRLPCEKIERHFQYFIHTVYGRILIKELLYHTFLIPVL
jgi:hypothetical protein